MQILSGHTCPNSSLEQLEITSNSVYSVGQPIFPEVLTQLVAVFPDALL